MKNEKLRKTNNQAGITLTALVIIILVLLILAGIVISIIFSKNGSNKKAKNAQNEVTQINAEKSEKNAQIKEKETNSTKSNIADSQALVTTLTSLIEKVATKNETVEDINENKIVVPKGFKIVRNGVSGVEYNYDSTNHTPCVQDGIVIEDVSAGDSTSKGNQFVWVPVGNINNKDSSKTTITLGRYKFNTTTGAIEVNQIVTTKNDVENLSDANAVAIDTYYKELMAKQTNGTEPAKDLKGWLKAAIKNGGYYIGRYEASNNGAGIALSKPSIGTIKTSSEPSTYTPGQLWNYVKQSDASSAAQEMYNNETTADYYSDLVNSYAWDTAILFIQNYSEDDKYSKNNYCDGLKNTGSSQSENKPDKYCNIYDMSGNMREWTTEYSTYSYYPCTVRGGYYLMYRSQPYNYTSYRNNYSTSTSGYNVGFRPTLYVK